MSKDWVKKSEDSKITVFVKVDKYSYEVGEARYDFADGSQQFVSYDPVSAKQRPGLFKRLVRQILP